MNTRCFRLHALLAATQATLLSLLIGSQATPARADLPEIVLHTFAGASTDGAESVAGIEIAPDGTYYGSTERGGTKNLGTIFKIAPNGTYTILHNFGDGSVANDGKYPTSLNIGSNGVINGMSIEGGADNEGAVFTVTPTGTVTLLHSFSGGLDGANPYGGVTIGNDGKIYGVTSGIADQSGNDYGTVFSMNTDGTQYAVQFRFTNANRATDGQNPDCTLAPGLSGDTALYGTTYSGGSANSGTIFSITPGTGDGSGTFQLLHTFGDGSVANDGANPDRGRMQSDSTGDFFSTTLYGGDSGNGTVWELTPSGTETILHSFEGDGDGANPEGTMTLASDGNYYGDTINDGAFGDGEVYTISKTGTFGVVYDFGTASDESDGANPFYGPAEDSNGDLVGTTYYGGNSSDGVGVVYQVTAGLPNPVKLLSATLTPTSVTSGSTSQLLITLKKPAPRGGAVVTLTSSAAAATVPSSVTIPANAETATVTVKTSAVSKSTSAKITAAYNSTTASATLTVTPGSGSTLTSVSLSPASTPGTLSTTSNSVSLSANASAATTVTLTSSNTGVATVPSSVVVKAGSSSQTFTIATQAVTSAQTVTITATAGGVSQTATLTVVPGLKSVTLPAASVAGGTTATTNRAYLTGNAAAATSVTITSSNSSVAKITTTPVTIASGSSSHEFTIATTKVTTTQTVTITATANGISQSAKLTVTP